MVCLDAAGAVVRPALLWNDTRSAQAAADLVAELGAAGVGRRDRQPAGRVVHRRRSCAGWPRNEKDNAAATAAVCLPHDWLTWRLRAGSGRRVASTTWSPTAATPAAPATGLGGHRRLPARPARARRSAAPTSRCPRVLGPSQAAGRTAATGRCSARAPATTRPPRSGSARCRGDVVVSIGHVRGGVRGERGAHRGPDRAPSPGSPRPPASTCRWCARSTRRGCSTPRPRCSASTTTGSPSWR